MIIKKECEGKMLANNILSISQSAAAAKNANKEVINATIGMLNGDDNEFYTFKTVEKVLKEVSYYDAFSYADTDGGEEYKKAVLKWLFGPSLNRFLDNYHVGVVATPGGSGAIATTFQNYLKTNEKVLVPSVMWETYITLAKERGSMVSKYSLYDENNNFDLADLKEKIEELMKVQESIILVINDPCHNPTGFCMTDNDYESLVQLLNSYNYPFVLLMDVAYFDFYDSDPSIIRNRYSILSKLNEKVLINFAFSGSKSFGLYGLRIGANVLFSKDKNEVTVFENAIGFTARSNWGSSSKLGASIISNLVLNEENYNDFSEEVKEVCSMLKRRSKVFLDEANRIGLEMLPYEKGFFVCVPYKDPVELMVKLREYDVWVVVTKTCIRVALCAVNEIEAQKLPSIISKAIEALKER